MKDCKACGARSPVDITHKLTAYIHKNPPPEKKDKYKQRNDRVATAENSGDEAEADRALEDDLAALPTAEEHNVDDNDWAADLSKEAVEARMKELAVSGAVSKLLDNDEVKLDGLDPLVMFADFLVASPKVADSVIIEKAQELDLRDDKTALVLAQVLLNQNILKEGQIKKRTLLFKKFVKDEKAQKAVIGGIERLVAISYPELLPSVALIFKDLYFNDLVEEEVFLNWNEKLSKKYVEKKVAKQIREFASPFITWLQDAEEESD